MYKVFSTRVNTDSGYGVDKFCETPDRSVAEFALAKKAEVLGPALVVILVDPSGNVVEVRAGGTRVK